MTKRTKNTARMSQKNSKNVSFFWDQHALRSDNAGRLVFLNGRYNKKLSNTSSLPQGVSFSNSKENGVFCYFPDNTIILKPLHIVFLTDKKHNTKYRNVFTLGAGSKICIYEEHIDLASTATKQESSSTLKVAAGAKLDYVKLYNSLSKNKTKSRSNNMTTVTALTNSLVKMQHIFLGGEKIEEKLQLQLAGENAVASIQSLAWLSNKEYTNLDIEIQHTAAKTKSHTLYKSIANDESHSVFRGKILVDRDARQSEGLLKNHNLLLSNKAQVDTLPELEIYADDVKCSHGATVGDLDEKALFYCASRGIAEKDARVMLLHAFLAEIVDKIEDKIIKEHIRHNLNIFSPDLTFIL